MRKSVMNIAIVGGGDRCITLMELIERHSFKEISPKIIAVADLKDDAPGLVKAREKGLITTSDYNDFFYRDDIDLIIELTGDMDIYNDLLLKKKKTVRAISRRTAQLFGEISRLSDLQQETKLELQKSRDMYDVIVNVLIKEDILVIRSDYRILDINDNLLKKLGLKREEAIGRFCYEIAHHQDMPCSGEEHPCPLNQSIESGKPSQVTHTHYDKDGKEIFYSISCYPVYENGEVVAAIEFSRDITKDIAIQKVMMLQEKLASIGRLSAGVAHEINNPLTTILTTSMLLQEDLDPESPIYNDLKTISRETLRCRKIVTSLLDFARQTKPSKKPLDLNDVINESIILTRKQAAFHDVSMEECLAKDLPPVQVDKDQIEQSLINLIINGIEATGAGGRVTVSSAFNSKKNQVEIAISDTGEGISEDIISKIFDPFYTSKESGSGLGLAITHGIIEQHGGTIEVESKLGEGATFKIRLPVDKGAHDAQ